MNRPRPKPLLFMATATVISAGDPPIMPCACSCAMATAFLMAWGWWCAALPLPSAFGIGAPLGPPAAGVPSPHFLSGDPGCRLRRGSHILRVAKSCRGLIRAASAVRSGGCSRPTIRAPSWVWIRSRSHRARFRLASPQRRAASSGGNRIDSYVPCVLRGAVWNGVGAGLGGGHVEWVVPGAQGRARCRA